MTGDPSTALLTAVESQYSCHATFVQTVSVLETFHVQSVREGVAYVLDIEPRPRATRAHSWSATIGGSDKRRFYAALQIGAIKTPLDAVRAAMVAER